MLIIISNMIMNLDKYIMTLNDEEEINEEEDFNHLIIKVKKFFEIEYDWNFTTNHIQANVINKINQELKNYLGNDSKVVQVKLWNYFDENKNLNSGTQKIYLMVYIKNILINDQINNSITIKLKNIGLSDFEIMTKVKSLFSQSFSFEQHFLTTSHIRSNAYQLALKLAKNIHSKIQLFHSSQNINEKLKKNDNHFNITIKVGILQTQLQFKITEVKIMHIWLDKLLNTHHNFFLLDFLQN